MSTPGNLIQEFSSRAFARLGGDPAKTGPWVPAPASATKRVTRHLEKQYGIAVSRMSRLDSGFKVERRDGPSWVARWFPPARPRAVVEGDADVLRFLEENDFPAERLAHPEPISDLDGFTIFVTEFVEGPQVHHPSGAQMYRLGELHGRLHTFPTESGALSRPAGSWHVMSIEGGTRRTDVEILIPLLDDAKAGAPKEHGHHFDALRAELEAIDHCEDLPHALIHIDYGGPNVLDSPDRGLVGVDWAGSGRGPRVFGLASLVASARRDPRLVDAFVAGYRKHDRLEDDELSRLAPAMRVHSLVLEAFVAVFQPARVAAIAAAGSAWPEIIEAAVSRAREAFEAKTLTGFEDVQAPPPMEDQFQILVDAVKDKSDDEITAFADAIGGYTVLCNLVFHGMAARLRPEADCNVGFVLGEGLGWVFRSVGGKVSVSKRIAKRAPAVVRTQPADFLRLITQDLDWDTAIGNGRVEVEGDPDQVARVFANGT